jgi:hypothetical protein
MLPKQAIAFPEVAIIRKGTPKRKYSKNGRESWIQGMDLGSRFRIAFAPGTDDVKNAFAALYPTAAKTYGPDYAEQSGFEMSRIRCMITTRNVSDAWEWANEAYNAGRLIARADDNHFIVYRNPVTGEHEIKNGEPFKEFSHGMSVDYERDGRKFFLPIRTYGRLSLFIPDLGRMVRFTLKTTSFYDRLNISANLAAIQFLADTLNGGNAAGIPFFVYRREQEITWNKPDGGAQRIKKWLVNIEADPEWVAATMQRMRRFALGGETIGPALLPPPVSGNVNPETAAEDEATGDYGDGPNLEELEELEGMATDIPDPVTPPAPAPASETQKTIQQLRQEFSKIYNAASTAGHKNLPGITGKTNAEDIISATAVIQAILDAK